MTAMVDDVECNVLFFSWSSEWLHCWLSAPIMHNPQENRFTMPHGRHSFLKRDCLLRRNEPWRITESPAIRHCRKNFQKAFLFFHFTKVFWILGVDSNQPTYFWKIFLWIIQVSCASFLPIKLLRWRQISEHSYMDSLLWQHREDKGASQLNQLP